MHRWPLVHPEVLQERPIKDNAGDAAQSACHLHERIREIVGGRRVRRLRRLETTNGLPMHWTRGGFPTPISSYQGAFIHHRSLAGAASGAHSEARPAKAFATILFICEDGGRMARRRILERGTVPQINSAAGKKK